MQRVTVNSFLKDVADCREPEVKMVGKARLVKSAGTRQACTPKLIIRRKGVRYV